jgi:hypothetical protein
VRKPFSRANSTSVGCEISDTVLAPSVAVNPVKVIWNPTTLASGASLPTTNEVPKAAFEFGGFEVTLALQAASAIAAMVASALRRHFRNLMGHSPSSWYRLLS